MSRRLIKAGIETWGYRRNIEKANEAYQKGYVSGVANDFDALVRMVHDNRLTDKLARKYGITATPTLLVTNEGKVVEDIVGGLDITKEIRRVLDAYAD